jgi:hypothetical protein
MNGSQVVPIDYDAIDFWLPRRRRNLAAAAAQRHLAALYARDPSTDAGAYDLATEARKPLPDDHQLS